MQNALNNDLISVIIPVYNVEKYLNKCLDSVIAQTYKNLEIILVNDGSTDNCKSICEDYAAKDSRIILIDQHNQGISKARNSGIEVAKGKYIGFVDSDDWIDCDMYETLHSYISNNEVDIVMCGLYAEREGKKCVTPQGSNQVKVYTAEEMAKKLLSSELSYNVWTKLYKKDLFKEVRFEEGKIFEDTYFHIELLKKYNKFAIIDAPKYHYLKFRQDSICNTSSIATYKSAITANKNFSDNMARMFPQLTPLCRVNRILFNNYRVYNIYSDKGCSEEHYKVAEELITDLRNYSFKELLSVKYSFKFAALTLRYCRFLYPAYVQLHKLAFSLKRG